MHRQIECRIPCILVGLDHHRRFGLYPSRLLHHDGKYRLYPLLRRNSPILNSLNRLPPNPCRAPQQPPRPIPNSPTSTPPRNPPRDQAQHPVDPPPDLALDSPHDRLNLLPCPTPMVDTARPPADQTCMVMGTRVACRPWVGRVWDSRGIRERRMLHS